MKQEIKINVLAIDDDDETIQFEIMATNGIITVTQEFYGYSDIFKELGTKLLSFPKNIDDNIKFEIGSRYENWAYYILLNIFCYEPNGYSAVHILIDNKAKMPYTNISEFYIRTVPASLNKLGQQFFSWNPTEKREISWIPEWPNGNLY